MTEGSFANETRRKNNRHHRPPSVNTINGKHGDDEICAEFTEQFQSVFRPNTVNTDAKYELEQQDLWRLTANYEDAFL